MSQLAFYAGETTGLLGLLSDASGNLEYELDLIEGLGPNFVCVSVSILVLSIVPASMGKPLLFGHPGFRSAMHCVCALKIALGNWKPYPQHTSDLLLLLLPIGIINH
jgi:hypothetical protein